jgi:hypothetical protein
MTRNATPVVVAACAITAPLAMASLLTDPDPETVEA